MKSISKLSKIALVVGASLTLAACGSSEEPETLQITQEVPDTPPAPPPPPTGGGDGSGSGDDGSGDDGSDDGSDEDDGSGGAGGDDGSDDEGGDDGSDEGGDDGSDEGGDDGSDEGGDDGSDEGGDDGSDEGGDDGSDEGGDEGDGEPGQVLFEEDIAEDIAQSTPTDVNIPLGIQATLDVEYLGAFRVEAGGESSSDYAVGTLGYNKDNNSIYMAGHAHHDAIAEFSIPQELSNSENISEIPRAAVLQDYITILDKKDVGNNTDTINGILYFEESLIVTSEIWYDGDGDNQDNLQSFSVANNLTSSPFTGMLQLEGAAYSAGYFSDVPQELKSELGSDYIVGWASNFSITSRYSQGPSIYLFKPDDVVNAEPNTTRLIDTENLMSFPLEEGKSLVEGGDQYSENISPIWGPLAKAPYGFIIPNTRLFLALGSNGGIHNGVGYKITQDDGNVCGGPCPYVASDMYNYFWIFSLDDILTAENPWDIRPISYGKWSHPYDENGMSRMIGATYNSTDKTLYMAIEGAGQTGTYDRPPLIISYKVQAQE